MLLLLLLLLLVVLLPLLPLLMLLLSIAGVKAVRQYCFQDLVGQRVFCHRKAHASWATTPRRRDLIMAEAVRPPQRSLSWLRCLRQTRHLTRV